MDPCTFVRIVVGNLGLKFKVKPFSSDSYHCKFKVKGFPTQVSDVVVVSPDGDAVESRIQACFSFRKEELEKMLGKSSDFSCVRIEVYRRRIGTNSCVFAKNVKLLGCFVVKMDIKSILENSGNNRRSVIQNGWVLIGGKDEVKMHLNVRAEPDPRFVFKFDGEPECSPQVFQVNGHLKQPVFTCRFGFRNPGDRILRSRSLSEPSSSVSCFSPYTEEKDHATKERKGWSITVHDLSGSPVAAASMVTPFVPSPGTDSVSRSNPGAWLILIPGHNTWKPWGRLEAWHQGNGTGYRFELIPDGGIDSIPLANSSISTKKGGKFTIDVTTGPATPIISPNSSFDLSSGSDLGSGSGSWAHLLFRGFVMSSTVEGYGKCSKPEVEIGAQHVTCTEDAAVFIALAAAMDLSVDACRLFSDKLRKELRQVDPES